MSKRSDFIEHIIQSTDKSTDNLNMANVLIKNDFVRVTSGGSRRRYVHPAYNLMIKVSKGAKGIIQNDREITLSKDTYLAPYINPVIAHTHFLNGHSFLFFENLKPLTAPKFKVISSVEFSEYAAIAVAMFKGLSNDFSQLIEMERDPKSLLYKCNHDDTQSGKYSATGGAIGTFVNDLNTLVEDYQFCNLNALSTYGYRKGTIKLTEYGLSEYMKEGH